MITYNALKHTFPSDKVAMLRFLSLLFVLISFSAHSVEYVYVTDKLYLGLHAKADSSSKRIKLMKSGVKLEVLDKSKRYTKVKTVSGVIGWSKTHLLLNGPTSAIKLEKLQEKVTQLEKKTFAVSAMQKEFIQIEEKLISSQTNNIKLNQEIESLKLDNQKAVEKTQTSLLNSKESSTLIISALIIILLIISAFLFGRFTFERKIRGEFNGYRIW